MTTENFSIVIPCFNRGSKLTRSLNSIENQSKSGFQVVIVDDASTDDTPLIIDDYKRNSKNNVKVITHTHRQERVASRNDGMLASTNDWICWLDSDDEYFSNTLEILSDAITAFPEYRIFNYGSVIQWHRHEKEFLTTIGNVFEPPVDGKGHVSFRSGHVGTGRFIFHRSLLDEIELMIPSMSPYGNPGCFPELNRNTEYGMREDGQWLPFGNPWGEDWLWFWKLTRVNHSKPLNMLLYIEHRRAV